MSKFMRELRCRVAAEYKWSLWAAQHSYNSWLSPMESAYAFRGLVWVFVYAQLVALQCLEYLARRVTGVWHD